MRGFHESEIARADRVEDSLPVQQPGQRGPAVIGELHDHVGGGQAGNAVSADLPPRIDICGCASWIKASR